MARMPASRSPAALSKASRQATPDGQPAHSLATLLDHLATLTRNRVRYADTDLPERSICTVGYKPSPSVLKR